MVKLRLKNASSMEEKDTPMPATRARAQHEPPNQMLLRFRPHDGSRRIQERSLVSLGNARPESQLHWRDLKAVHAAGHIEPLSDFIIAAFSEVEQKMAPALAVALKEDVVKNWNYTCTKGFIYKAKLESMFSYAQLTGTSGFKKKLCYPNWFFLAVWLGPGHPLLESIRKDMSDLWGVQFPTDAIIYPTSIPVEAQMKLFYGKPATTPDEDSIEKRAKAIKKTIDDSPVNGLSAVIKGHLQHDLKEDTARMHALEKSLASTNRELDEAKKHVSNLEKQLAESKASQARASTEQEKTKSDMETLRKEMNALRSEVAQSAERAEKAVETGALVLSVLSTPGGQKRKMDEIS